MRITRKLFPALLCGTVLLAAGCGRDAEQEGRIENEETSSRAAIQPAGESKGYVIEEPAEPEATPEAAPESVATEEAAELRREPREPVVVSREAELEARERQLEQRQAALAARERELRRSEQRPAPRPDRTEPTDRTDPSDDEITEITAPADTAGVNETSRPVEVEPEVEAAPEEEELERPRTLGATVPAGTLMEVELLEGLSSDTTRAGETFRARVVSDIRTDGGEVAIPDGSEVVGVVDEVVPLRKVGGRAKIALRFTDLVLPSGATVPIRASLVEEGRNETRKDAATIGGATAGGAILGRILSKRGDRSRGAVIGAIIGAAAGTAIASRTPGEEVVLAEGSLVNISLDDDVEIRSRR